MTNNIKNKIVTTYYELGMQNGFNQVCLKEVARRLNLEEKIIYEHYSNREILVKECVMRVFEEIDSQISPLMDDSQLDTLSKWNRIILVVVKNLEWISHKHLFEFQQQFPHIWEIVNDERKKRIAAYEKLITQGIREGVFRPYPPKFIVRLYFMAIQEFTSAAWLNHYNLTMADSLKKIHSLILQGIISPKIY